MDGFGRYSPEEETIKLDGTASSETRPKRVESKEYFFSESLGKYVGIEPIKIDESVLRAAAEIGIDLNWDDEGRIVNVSFVDLKRLFKQIGATILSPSEYWKVYQDATKEGRSEVLEQLKSDQTTEWLDAVYLKDEQGAVTMIEHPDVSEDADGIRLDGDRVEINMPEGRPGWFDPRDNIDEETGLPVEIITHRKRDDSHADHWKYWSAFKINDPVAAIRGFVTSVGMPSLDCDIPLGAKQPVLMIREARGEIKEPGIAKEIIERATELIEIYKKTTAKEPAVQNPDEHEYFYGRRQEALSFFQEHGEEILASRDKEALQAREQIADILGTLRLIAEQKNDQETLSWIEGLSKSLFTVEDERAGTIESFAGFLSQSRVNLENALAEHKKIVFVMGHKNPDTDSVISCVAEAYRNSLADGKTAYIPVVQASRMPDEIEHLLGKELSDSILLSSEDVYEQARVSGLARWILVDQNVSDVQKYTESIIDHHILSQKAQKQEIAKSWEMAGSTTALVAQKLLGMGIELDEELSKILYGATLMDTENRSYKKMTYKDKMIMDRLRDHSQVPDDDEFYQELMGYLLNTDDAERLFSRDYKQDWGIFGFAVAKIKGGFDPEGHPLKPELLERLAGRARQNNQEKNFALTIVKVVDYLENNETVNRERLYLEFNPNTLPQFKEFLYGFIQRVIRRQFGEKVQINIGENFIDFYGTGDQLSRKVTAPFLEPIVEAFNEYYFSESTGLYIKRAFLEFDADLDATAQECEIKLSFDKNGRVNNITFPEVKILFERMNYDVMTLSEYWKVYHEAHQNNDEQMKAHLVSPGFVEYLDTVILDRNSIVDNPELSPDGKIGGERKEVDIPIAEPGLIYPEDIVPETGFPHTVQGPKVYGDPRLWRYWSPDEPACLVTRGHIFLLNQPALDTKVHMDDALPNLGVRPCARKISAPELEIVENGNEVTAKVIKKSKALSGASNG